MATLLISKMRESFIPEALVSTVLELLADKVSGVRTSVSTDVSETRDDVPKPSCAHVGDALGAQDTPLVRTVKDTIAPVASDLTPTRIVDPADRLPLTTGTALRAGGVHRTPGGKGLNPVAKTVDPVTGITTLAEHTGHDVGGLDTIVAKTGADASETLTGQRPKWVVTNGRGAWVDDPTSTKTTTSLATTAADVDAWVVTEASALAHCHEIDWDVMRKVMTTNQKTAYDAATVAPRAAFTFACELAWHAVAAGTTTKSYAALVAEAKRDLDILLATEWVNAFNNVV